jgi:hypothetical protein
MNQIAAASFVIVLALAMMLSTNPAENGGGELLQEYTNLSKLHA